ncbi:MAG TPA: DUF2298 domain-containing protein [Ktedonobacteraceae bacterium]|nr:DUF2298 domain-containing protein [Ktedonobacteraceae bacterium]
MLELLQMWAIVEALGIIFLPLTTTVFHNLPDRGWAFSKAIGVAVLAFSVWLPLMTLHFLPFSQLFILGVLILLFVLNVIGFLRVRKALVELVRTHFLYIICVELIFFGMVFLLGWLRSLGPDISSFEMYMDEGFLSAIMRSPHFPPNDMWYAGQSINYYYYAHYTVAMLAKLLGQSPSVAFNTGISMFFGLTAVNLFGVTTNIVAWAQHNRRLRRQTTGQVSARPDRVLPLMSRAIPYGILSILLGEVLGNLAATQTWWQNHDGTLPYFYWFNASRVITNTINEFPAFSFLLSCFHAHVLALAFTIVGIALAFNLFLEHRGQGLQAFGTGWRMPLTLVVTALLIGSLYAMNGWDYPTYLALALVCLVLQQWRAHQQRINWDLVLDLFTAGAALAALSFFLFAPFYLNFVSPAQGLGLVKASDRTPLPNEVLIYGVFAFVFVSFLLVSFFRPRVSAHRAAEARVALEAGADQPRAGHQEGEARSPRSASLSATKTPAAQERGVQATAEIVREATAVEPQQGEDGLDQRVADLDHTEGVEEEEPAPAGQEEPEAFSTSGLRLRDMRVIGLLATLLLALCLTLFLRFGLTFAVTGGLAGVGAVLTLYHLKERERSFTLLLGSVACALVAFCEIVFLRDVFADQVPRMNTVFKFYFQAWALLSIAGGAGVYFVLDSLRPALRTLPTARWTYTVSRVLWSAALLVFLLMGAVYPLTAVHQRFEGFKQDTSLDGLDYMRTSSPGDYQAIRWLNANVSGDPVIVEAPGGEYSLYGRVSVFTGLPSPINWQGHEWQWRVNWVTKGLNSADFSRRVNDVNQIYTDNSPQNVLALMARYNAQYLYVGGLEQQSYVGANLTRFASFMKVVYQHDGVTIYQVP